VFLASCEDFSMKHGSKLNYANNNNNNNDDDDDNNDALIKCDLKTVSTGDAKSLPGNQQPDCGQTSRCNDLPVNGPSITSLSKTSSVEQCKQSNLVHSSVDDVIGATTPTTPTRTASSLPSPRPSSTDVVVNDDEYDEEDACDTPTSLSPSHSVTPSGTPSRMTPGLPATPGSGSGSASSLTTATNRPAQMPSVLGTSRSFAVATAGVSVAARCPPVREAVDPAKYITLSGDLDGVKYACSKCGNVYKWRKSLNKHWKEKHDGETPDPPGSSSAAARLAIATQHQQMHGSAIGHHSQLSPSDGHGKHGVLSMVSNGRSIFGGRNLSTMKTSPDAACLTSAVGSAASRHLKGSLAALNPSLFSKFTLNRSTPRIVSQHHGQPQQLSPLGVSGVTSSWSPHHPAVVDSILKVPDFLGTSVAASSGAKTSSDHFRPSYDVGQGQMDASGATSVSHRSEKPVDLSESSRPYRQPAMTNDGGDDIDVLDLSKKSNDHVSGQWTTMPSVADELFAVQDEPLDFSTKTVSGGGGSSTTVNGFSPAANTSRASSAAAALGGQQHQQLFLASARFPQLDNVAPVSSATRDVAAPLTSAEFVDRKLDVGALSCAQCHAKFTSSAELNRHFSREHADVLHLTASDRRQTPGCSTGSAQLYRYLTNETLLPAPVMAHHGGGAGSDSTSCVVCGKWLPSRALASKHFDEQHSAFVPNNPYRHSGLQQAHSSTVNRLDIDEPPRKKTILDGRTNHVRSDSFSAYVATNQLHQSSPGLVMTGRMNGGGSVHAGEDFKPDLLLSQCDDEQTAIVIPQAPEDASSLMTTANAAGAVSKIYVSTAHQQQQQQPQAPVNVRVGSGTSGRARRADLLGLTASGSSASAAGGSTAAAEALLPFKCPLCEYRARWPSEMTQHAKNHSDEKPFRCPQCSYRSKWKWDVVKHLKRCGGGNCTARDVIDTSASPANGAGGGAPGAATNVASLSQSGGGSSASTQRRRRFHTSSNRSVLLNAAPIQQLQHSQVQQQLLHPQNVAIAFPEQRNGPIQGVENQDLRSSTSAFLSKQEADFSGQSQVADRNIGDEIGGSPSISSPDNLALKAALELTSEQVGEQSAAAAVHATPCNEASQTSIAGQLGQGLHYCGQCPFVGHSPAELRRHQRVHSDEKPYSCRTCSYSSKWKCDLKKHLRAYNHVSAVPLVYGGHGRKPTLPADWDLGRIGLADPRDLVGLVRDSDFFDQSFMTDAAAATGDGHAEGSSDSGRSTDERSGAGKGRHQPATGNGLAAGITTGGRLRCRRCDFEAVDITSFLQHKTIHHSGRQSAGQRVRDNVENAGNADVRHGTASGAEAAGEYASGGQHHHRRKSSKQIRVLPTLQTGESDQSVGPEVRRATSSQEQSSTNDGGDVEKQDPDAVCDEERFWKSLGLKCKNRNGRKPLVGILNRQSEIASGSAGGDDLTVRDQSGWNAGRLAASEDVTSAVGSPAVGTPHPDDAIDCDNRSSISGNTSGTDETDVECMEGDDSLRNSVDESGMNVVDGWSEPVDLCSRNVVRGDDHEHSENMSPTGSQHQHPGNSGSATAMSSTPARRHWSWSKGIEGCTWRTSLNGSSGPGSSGSAEAEDAASMSRRKRKLRTCDKCGYVTDNLTTLQRHTAKHGSTGELIISLKENASIVFESINIARNVRVNYVQLCSARFCLRQV
jgi:DNA-directed RNA polymerase subunit M/transcription elongation factor TFIIS